MNDIVPRSQTVDANQMRSLMALYEQNYDLISIGAYKKGTNLALDVAIEKIDRIHAFLQQEVEEKLDYDETVLLLKQAIRDEG